MLRRPRLRRALPRHRRGRRPARGPGAARSVPPQTSPRCRSARPSSPSGQAPARVRWPSRPLPCDTTAAPRAHRARPAVGTRRSTARPSRARVARSCASRRRDQRLGIDSDLDIARDRHQRDPARAGQVELEAARVLQARLAVLGVAAPGTRRREQQRLRGCVLIAAEDRPQRGVRGDESSRLVGRRISSARACSSADRLSAHSGSDQCSVAIVQTAISSSRSVHSGRPVADM